MLVRKGFSQEELNKNQLKTFSADQIQPYFAEGHHFEHRKFATYRFYEHERSSDHKKMLMIEIKLTDRYYSDDGKIIPEELLN